VWVLSPPARHHQTSISAAGHHVRQPYQYKPINSVRTGHIQAAAQPAPAFAPGTVKINHTTLPRAVDDSIGGGDNTKLKYYD